MTPIFVHAKDLRGAVGMSRAQCYVLMKRGEFPRPKKISDGRAAWRHSDFLKWAETRNAA